ncbi:MAG: nucleotidyltransferase family protein [Acetatifactor sp.]|nr:nucleotidyltransferase family protein [Acetatifactor sp.]
MNELRMLKFIGDASMAIVDAMAKIDVNSKGILFITDDAGILSGCITDGDIRRWILGAGDINACVCSAMNSSPQYLYAEERIKAEEVMRRKAITALPILDRKGHIIDIILSNEISNVQPEERKKDLSEIPVVIMAGGKGTRLYPYTKILPKPLIPIGETPIVERIIKCFTEYGISKFYMTVNYKKSVIKSYFLDIDPPYEIDYVEEPKPLGTCGSIKLINEKFEEPLFVTNCDSLIMADYGDIYDYHMNHGNSVTMVSALKNIAIPYGVIHSGDSGEVLRIEEKPKLSYFINTGMYVINPDLIDKIPTDEMFHMTDLIEAVMAAGEKVGMYPISEDSFLDMGEISEMKRMEEKLNIVSD